ncbi:hypothetical protein V2G26_017310 [Clonostachys chloroleuca]
MANILSDHLRGIVQVPLQYLYSNEVNGCPESVPRFLSDPRRQLLGIIDQQTYRAVAKQIGLTKLRDTLKQDGGPLPIVKVKICALLGQGFIDQAKEVLGPDFNCVVRLYYIPSVCNDGFIYRMASECVQRNDIDQANQWGQKLQSQGPKQRHLKMIFGRGDLVKAMDAMIPFTGLWEDLRLGNFAKYFAAHCDDLIINYWNHMNYVWCKIFSGVESLKSSLDPATVRELQRRAPAWSAADRDYISKRMINNKLFINISMPSDRARLLDNLLKLDAIVISILTFDEDMQYLAIGVKILEKQIEVKPKKRSYDYVPTLGRESLESNLRASWKDNAVMEIDDGLFGFMDKSCHRLAFTSLVLLALREFPFLQSTVRPLQDIKGDDMKIHTDQIRTGWLCKVAEAYGYSNEKIAQGISVPYMHLEPGEELDVIYWRGGRPSISQFWSLRGHFFLYKLAKYKPTQFKHPELPLLQKEFVEAFLDVWVRST